MNVGYNLAKEIVNPVVKNDVDESTININPNTIFLKKITERELIDVVKKFKNKKSTDCIDVDMALVKDIIDSIARPLTHICNQSFQTGIFPNQMKIAKVIPIYKNGNKHQFSNYRPISLLPQFSKILEKLFIHRLDHFIETQNLLSEHQYGFRSNRSTTMAVMELTEKILSAIDKREYTVGVFMDLQKAFDTIDHNLLMTKLERYGIRGIAYTWLKNYLDNRKQYVQLNDEKSDLLRITCGVPQGSVLGPKLFIMYINDICNVSKLLHFVLFADDTNLLCSGKDLRHLLDTVERELGTIKRWFDINKLSLNLNKTKYIVFGDRKNLDQTQIRINNIEIQRVNINNFLGVIMDDKISWKPHINHIKSKISKSIAILNKTKYILNKYSLHLLYRTFVEPYITYCIEVWGHAYKTITKPIFILQKRAIRIINRADYRDSTNTFFINLQTLKFNDLVDYKTAQIMYKVNNNMLPDGVQRMFQTRTSRYELRGTYVYTKAKVRTNVKQRCISIKGVNQWNNLELEIKLCNTLNRFKKLFKNNIINKYKTEL